MAQVVKESNRFQPATNVGPLSMDGDDDEDNDEDDMMGDTSGIDSPSPEDYIVNVGDLEGDNDAEDAGAEDDGELGRGQPVDPLRPARAVLRDGLRLRLEQPRHGAGALRVELAGFVPNRGKDFLQHVFGIGAIGQDPQADSEELG
mgnify:CR=1 FL=1